MKTGRSFPTPYPEANLVLNELLPEVQAILRDRFIGMYLYGSLAYGGFDQDSDVDYVVVTREELPEALFSALDVMHMRITGLDSWCAAQLEGAYLPLKALLTYDPVHVFHLMIDRGPGERLHRMHVEDERLRRAWWSGWVFLRAVLWEHGLRLAGPEIRTLIDPVPAGELKQAALATLECWFEPLLEELGELADPGYPSYAVLTMCRLLYTLERGAIASKPAAARWAQERLEERWRLLIDRAWIGRHNPGNPVSPEELAEIRAFISCMLERSAMKTQQGEEK